MPSEKQLVARFMRQQYPNMPSKAQQDAMSAMVGQALTDWSRVETALCDVFLSTIQPKRPAACSTAFHSLNTFGLKLTAADAALHWHLQGNAALMAQWERLRDRMRSLMINRNHCAHFVVYVYFNEKNKTKRVMLEPLTMDYRHGTGVKRKRYRKSDINAFCVEFRKLAMDVLKFNARLVKLP